MNGRNGRGVYSNSSYESRFSIPFPANSNQSFVPNPVPLHPMPFQNQFYPPQHMNVPHRPHCQRSAPSTQGLSVPRLHTDYYPNIPLYEDRSGTDHGPTAAVNSNFSNLYRSTNICSDKNNSCDTVVAQESRSKPALHQKPIELKVSAEIFVPRNISEHDGSTANNIHPSDSNNSKVNRYKNKNIENNNQYGTRPKEFYKGRGGASNRKNWVSNNVVHNWPNKENKGYNYSAYKNTDFSMSVSEGAASFSSNNHCNIENQRQRPQYQSKGYNNYNDESNGYYNSRNRGNPAQKRQNYNPRRPEWRKYNEQSYDYNYYEENRTHPNTSYNKKGPKSYNSYSNGNMKENIQDQIKPKEMQDHRQNRTFTNSKDKHLTSTNNSNVTNLSIRRNDISDELDKRKSSDLSTEIYDDENEPTHTPLSTEDEKTQRENMVENLSKGIYECMVCCERIKQPHAIWSCNNCYNCFHLGCIKKWAGTSHGEPGWRCPACQNQNSKIPNGYFCFCKKFREPEWNRRETPHSCGEMCGKKRKNEWCTHKCTILCHPGPCPDCTAFIKRQCQCGKKSQDVRCSQVEAYVCEEKCSRSLNCGVHLCEKLCHIDECGPCSWIKEEDCFCNKEKRSVKCTPETANEDAYSCNAVCNKRLSCGHHFCEDICHAESCKPCSRAVDTVNTCPCGKKNVNSKARASCLDTIPTCGESCGKALKCGVPGSFHACRAECHEGACPQCQDQTAVKCRCGFMDKKIPCAELLSKADEVTCEKQCKKLRQCGRHKCGLKCCIDIDHCCTRVCGRTLKCRLHKCQEPCHRGNCSRCWETSFDELSCHCGASVLYPPINCGTEPPNCELPCRRRQSCNHPVSHSCHSDPKCPPCTTLISKPCFGGHMTMKSTPCYVSANSCGEQCAKRLQCGVHLCQKVCHEPPCTQGADCTQKCAEVRPSCEHPCNNPCHAGPCPDTPCREMVTVSCVCGNRKVDIVCSENEREYKSMATSKLASELHSLNSGGSVDISQIFCGTNKPEKLKRLDCNDDCGLVARNRQLALALQIANPDARESLKDGGSHLFSDGLKEDAKRDLQFAQMVHATLQQLVMKAKQSKQKSRSHSFVPMNRDKRRFIHEYSKHFGCQSQAYDEEPKKNVVVTAYKAASRLPPVSVVVLVQKEQGQRKAPGPVISRKGLTGEEMGTQMRRLEKNSSFEKKETSPKDTPTKEQAPVIDYFDFS